MPSTDQAAGANVATSGRSGPARVRLVRRGLAVTLLVVALAAGTAGTAVTLARLSGPPARPDEPAAAPPVAEHHPVAGQPGPAAGQASHAARHGDHAPPGPASSGPAQGGGLSVSSGSYLLAPGVTRFQPGEAGTFRFRILDASGRPVTAFQRVHDKLLHLIVVRRDLTGYQHLHPTLGDDGTWSTRITLPAAGTYRAFTDFVTEAGAQTLGVDLFAPGRFAATALPAPSATAGVAGYQIAMRAAPATAGQPRELAFQVSRDGWTVADLEPYLGARGHLVALREGDLAYLHVHPEDAATPGSSIRFHATFPSAGRYRLFLQFQHAGQIRTAAFTVQVH